MATGTSSTGRNKALELRKAGLSYAEIATACGIPLL
jgi:DNA-directed RNA polymerase specialized sigma24 family protein